MDRHGNGYMLGHHCPIVCASWTTIVTTVVMEEPFVVDAAKVDPANRVAVEIQATGAAITGVSGAHTPMYGTESGDWAGGHDSAMVPPRPQKQKKVGLKHKVG